MPNIWEVDAVGIGAISNEFLNRDDTNGRDELTLRGHLKWLASDDLTLRLRYLHLDLDNGYDAFSLNNTRETYSDQPGADKQKTNAVSLNTVWNKSPIAKLETDISVSETDTDYGYDEDWSYTGEFDESLYPYSSYDQYIRNRNNASFEATLISKRDGLLFLGNSFTKLGWISSS